MPLNVLVAIAVVMSAVVAFYHRDKLIVEMLFAKRLAVGLVMIVVAIAVAVEGIWGIDIHRMVWFVALLILMLIQTGVAVIVNYKSRRWHSMLCHFGFFLILVGGMLGSPDVVKGEMIAYAGNREHFCQTASGRLISLPFNVELKDFRIEYYEDGKSPKQYISTIYLDGEERDVRVNHPCYYRGYFIYQADYDHQYAEYSVLQIVKDPWLPVVYFGIALLAFGAIWNFKRVWSGKATLPIIIFVAVVFAVISVARINFGMLVPALRSLWFVPHLIIYMLAYSVLVIAVVMSVLEFCGIKWGNIEIRQLVATAEGLIILGMLCGAVWAKAAWGDYWTWDPKECWAATTWLLTLAGSHLQNRKENRWISVMLCVAAFAAMQVTWYGVKYLPSAEKSVHVYKS